MTDSFWRVFAVAATAMAVLFAQWPRFNAVTTMLGAILLLLLLTARQAGGGATVERLAFAAVFGLVSLLVVGRLLEEVSLRLPFYYTREVFVAWLALCVLGWRAGRAPSDDG